MDIPEWSDLSVGDRIDITILNCCLPIEPEKDPRKGWLAIVGGKIEDMSKGEMPGHRRVRDTMVLDLPDLTVLPGMYDSHMHLYQWSISKRAVDLSRCTSYFDMIRTLKGRLEGVSLDPFFDGTGLLFGVDYDESQFTGERNFDGRSLEKSFPDDPVMIRRVCGHKVICNEMALSMLDAPLSDDGVLLENDAMKASWSIPIHEGSKTSILEEGVHEMRSLGVLGGVDIIPEIALKDTLTSYRELMNSPRMSISVQIDEDSSLSGPVRDAEDWDGPFSEKGIFIKGETPVIFSKLFMDGSIGARTASFYHPYIDSEPFCPLMSVDELKNGIDHSLENGLIPMIHAIGNRAVSTIFDAHEDSSGPIRIEHMESITKRDLYRSRDPKFAVCMQPNFQHAWGYPGGLYDQALGDGRTELNDFRSALQNLHSLSFGSDMMPFGPLYGIKAAIGHQDPSRSISYGEAIHLYSKGSAIMSFPGLKDIGSLIKGAGADIVIFDKGSSRSSLTMMDGIILAGKMISK